MSDCIEHSGGTFTKGGYGRVWISGRHVMAHRLAYEKAHGPIPDGLLVCHSCDNPPCVNPEHLWLGTTLDNARDRVAKGRNGPRPRLYGAESNSHLAIEQVEGMRARRLEGATYRTIAEEFDVAVMTAHRIVNGVTWPTDRVCGKWGRGKRAVLIVEGRGLAS